MNIYYITSEIESTLSGKTRWNNLTKKQILKKSWISLNQSINETDYIHIIHDKVSKNTLNWMSESSQGIVKFITVKRLSLNKYNFLSTTFFWMVNNAQKYYILKYFGPIFLPHFISKNGNFWIIFRHLFRADFRTCFYHYVAQFLLNFG